MEVLRNPKKRAYRKLYAVIALVVLLLFGVLPSLAQRQAEHWYFGDSVSISFAGSVPVVGRAQLKTREGCAAWSDPQTGAPLIYTDGQTVWDGTDGIMAGGTELEGHESSAQSALLVPQPDNPGSFFLFTAGVGPYEVPDNNGIRYSIVNAVQKTVSAKNNLLLEPASEKLVGIRHCNEKDYWVVAQQWGSNKYYAWQVSTSGVSQPVISSTGTVAPFSEPSYTIGCLKASPDGRKMVNTGYYPNAVQLFDFNNSTGVVSNPLTLPTNDIVYCTSFSPDNSRLYVFEQRLSGSQTLIRLYQYTVTGTHEDIVQSRTMIFQLLSGAIGDDIGALQIAPNGKIYCAREGGLYLGVINAPNAAGTACDYSHDGLYLNGRRSALGLPNFIDGLFNTGASCFPPEARFDVDTTICAGMCLHLSDKSLNQPSQWRWELPGGTPAVSTEREPMVCYHTPGVYDVRLIVSNPKGVDTLIRRAAVTVRPRLGAQAGSDTSMCKGEVVTLSGLGGERYSWRPTTGLTSPNSAITEARPESTTMYILTVYGGACEDYDTVTVTVFSQAEARSGEYTICAGDSIQHEAAGSEGVYRWFPVEGVSDPDISNPLLFPTTTTEYQVTVTSEHNCTSTATVRVEIGEAWVDAGRDTAVCAGQSVRLAVTGMTGSYEWTPTDGLDDPTSATPLATPEKTTTYTVTVTGSSGCTAVDNVTITVLPLPVVNAGDDVVICKNSSTQLVAIGSAGTYVWTPADGLDTPEDSVTIARPTVTTTYRVTFTDVNGCTASDEVTVVVDETLAVDAGDDQTICAGDTVQLDAWAGSGTYRWTPETGLDDPTSARPLALPAVTTVYYVDVATDGGCSGRDSVTVTVLPRPIIDAGNTTSICAGGSVRLVVQGEGNVIGWEPTEFLDDPRSRTPLAFPTITTVFTVTVQAPGGCVVSDTVRVIVATPKVQITELDTTLCAGTSLLLHAAGGTGTYRWEPAEFVGEPQQAVTAVRPPQSTRFVVTYTDETGCSAIDSIFVVVREAASAELVLPDVVASLGQQEVRFPVVLRSDNPAELSSDISIRFDVVYDARLLDFTGVTRGRILENRILPNPASSVVSILVEHADVRTLPDGVLTELTATILLSATDTTLLSLRNIATEPQEVCLLLQPMDGKLRLDGYCFGSDFRRFEQPRFTVTPNPATEYISVVLHAPEGSAVTTGLYTTWGQHIIGEHLIATSEERHLSYDVSQLAAGVYYLAIDIDGSRFVQPVCIVK